MILTSKGRYAVMAMVDIAIFCDNKPMSIERISERQNIAAGYLEQIFAKLRKFGLVTSIKGPGGGYILANDASNIFISDIIKAVEEEIRITRCDKEKGKGCIKDNSKCLTHDLWVGLGNQIHNYLQSISLADVCKNSIEKNLVFKVEGKVVTEGN